MNLLERIQEMVEFDSNGQLHIADLIVFPSTPEFRETLCEGILLFMEPCFQELMAAKLKEWLAGQSEKDYADLEQNAKDYKWAGRLPKDGCPNNTVYLNLIESLGRASDMIDRMAQKIAAMQNDSEAYQMGREEGVRIAESKRKKVLTTIPE